MRHWTLCIGSLAALCALAPAQTQKQRALGDALAKDIDRQVQRINDPSIIEYLQRVENRLALAAGVKPLELRLVRNAKLSARLLPNGVLYISSGLLERIESEAELAGLLAHEQAHLPWPPSSLSQTQAIPLVFLPVCVLQGSAIMPVGWIKERREPEMQATAAAVKTLKAAGYDPEAVLELFSKLSYENPPWSKAIVSGDLFDLRATLETDLPPPGGYLIDGSGFLQMHARLARLVGQEARNTPN